MKTYKLTAPSSNRSTITASMVQQMSDGKSGDLLIKEGFSQGNFVVFLARLASKASEAGYDADQLAQIFSQVGAGNASQVRQACLDIQIEGEDFPPLETASGKPYPMTLEKLWGKGEAKAIPNLSLLGKL